MRVEGGAELIPGWDIINNSQAARFDGLVGELAQIHCKHVYSYSNNRHVILQ